MSDLGKCERCGSPLEDYGPVGVDCSNPECLQATMKEEIKKLRASRAFALSFAAEKEVKELRARVAQLEADNAYKEAMISKAFAVLELYGVPRARAKSIHNGIDVLMTRINKESNLYTEMLTDAMKVVAVAQVWADDDSVGADVLLRAAVQTYNEKMKRLNEGLGPKPE